MPHDHDPDLTGREADDLSRMQAGQPLYVTGDKAQAGVADEAKNAMRDRILPMIALALRRYPPKLMFGLDVTGWDFCILPGPQGIVAGVAMAVRGVDLIGPGKEVGQFVGFNTWNPVQDDVDQVVQILGQGLQAIRQQQATQGNMGARGRGLRPEVRQGHHAVR